MGVSMGVPTAMLSTYMSVGKHGTGEKSVRAFALVGVPRIPICAGGSFYSVIYGLSDRHLVTGGGYRGWQFLGLESARLDHAGYSVKGRNFGKARDQGGPILSEK